MSSYETSPGIGNEQPEFRHGPECYRANDEITNAAVEQNQRSRHTFEEMLGKLESQSGM